jgi:hypothetical protein
MVFSTRKPALLTHFCGTLHFFRRRKTFTNGIPGDLFVVRNRTRMILIASHTPTVSLFGMSLETGGHCSKISQRWILQYSATFHCRRTMCYYLIALGLFQTQSPYGLFIFDMFAVDRSPDSIQLETSHPSTKY